MAQRFENDTLEAAYAALLSQGLDGAGEALRIFGQPCPWRPSNGYRFSTLVLRAARPSAT